MEQTQEQRKGQLRIALRMAEALQKEARRAAEQPPGLRPEVLVGVGRQFNELVNWLQQELGVRLPLAPIHDDPDPFTLSFAATQLVGALRVLLGEEEEAAEEESQKRKREREPILRIREQKSPVEFSEVVITSAEELADLLRTGLPSWLKTIVREATGVAGKAVSRAVATAEQPVERSEAETVRLSGAEPTIPLHERLEEFAELLEDTAEELEEIEEEWREAEEEGELTEERKAQLQAKQQRLLQRVHESLHALQQILGPSPSAGE